MMGRIDKFISFIDFIGVSHENIWSSEAERERECNCGDDTLWSVRKVLRNDNLMWFKMRENEVRIYESEIGRIQSEVRVYEGEFKVRSECFKADINFDLNA
jgi:hypothetical protein